MKAILNWRYAVMAVLLASALFLIGSTSESETAFYLSKPLGFACGYVLFRLVRRWESQGKLPEMNDNKIK